MKSRYQWFNWSIVMLVTFSSCDKPLPELKEIDITAWKNDKHGCKGVRAIAIDELEEQKDQLLGLREMQIIDLLGKPDQNELYKRNQKFFYYNLQPGSECIEQTSTSITRLTIRFNAVGLAKEINIE
jgi:hypothetical protein